MRVSSPAAPILTLLVALVTAAFPVQAASQTPGLLEDCSTSRGKNSSSTSINDENDVRHWRISWSNDRCSIDMRAEGKFEFEQDLSDVKSMERGAFLEIDVRREGDRRRYEVSHEGGELVRTYTVNRSERPIDDEARRWIAAMILELERRSGFAAPTRVAALLRAGGPTAVMDEVTRMSSDHVQRKYLSVMLDSARLESADVRRAINLSGEELASDHEHASFLVDLGRRSYVTTDVAGDFVKSTGSIQSDYERRRALGAVLTMDNLPAATVGELLRAAGSFNSDYERAELLIATAKANGFPDGPARDAYLDAASGIRSDHEKHRVLLRLTKAELTEDQLVALLSVAKGINSDYQLATLLIEVSDGRTLDGRARDAYLAATETLNSDYERRRALTALLGTAARGRM
jgi:hypothetical protein